MVDEHDGDEHEAWSDHDRAPATGAAPLDVERKVDIVAGAVASLEGQMAQMAAEVASLGPKLDELLDRHPAGLGAASETTAAVASDVATAALEPVHTGLAALEASTAATREELHQALEAVERLATAVGRLDDKTEDRLAAVRDAAMTPVTDLQAILAGRGDRVDKRLEEVTAALDALRGDLSDDGRAALLDAVEELGVSVQTLTSRAAHSDVRPLTERIDELGSAVQALTWQLPELAEEVAALRVSMAGMDDEDDEDQRPQGGERGSRGTAPRTDPAGDELVAQVTDRVEAALAGLLRLIDERLATVRLAVSAGTAAAPPPPPAVGGFEAGAVMGAAQAAWNRLEQRLDDEFDDLSRQLQAMATMIEQTAASAEAAANRPVVTSDQLRHAASTVKDSVLRVSRARRERRGGPRGLGSGS